jgi:hypothetical protein
MRKPGDRESKREGLARSDVMCSIYTWSFYCLFSFFSSFHSPSSSTLLSCRRGRYRLMGVANGLCVDVVDEVFGGGSGQSKGTRRIGSCGASRDSHGKNQSRGLRWPDPLDFSISSSRDHPILHEVSKGRWGECRQGREPPVGRLPSSSQVG